MKHSFALLTALLLAPLVAIADLEQDFASPPAAAKPWAYMWRNYKNATPADYTRHLEQLKDKGFGGFVEFGWNPPALASDPRLPHILQEAERCGLIMIANNTGSWPAGGSWMSRTNLPWATVSSTLDVDGGRRFSGKLPEPPLPADGNEKIASWIKTNGVITIAVQALRLPDQPAPAAPTVTASSNAAGLPALFDGSWNTVWTPDLPAPNTKPFPAQWILLDFGAPRDVDAIWLDTRLTAHLESSDDGVHFKPFLTMPRPTFELFPAQRARYFRVLFGGPANKPEHWAVRELKLGCRAEVERHIQFAAKRALNLARPTVPFQRDEIAPALQPLAALPTDRPLASPTLIDLTEKVSADGQLDWDVPPGRWRIVWLRRSIASGMEVAMGLPDYLSAAATREDFEKGMNKLGQAAGAKAGKVLRYHHEDNNEIHSLYNWTPAMLDEFQRRRGYDARRYLATLAGEIVDSVEITDRFLNDLRRTVADCVAENHYAQWTALTHAAGLLTRCEAGGPYHPRVLCHDGLMNLARVDLMEGEFWHDATWTENWRTNLTDKLDAREGAQNHSVKQVASASHLYGKPIVDMESLTSFNYWSAAPRDFLLPANIAFCEGVNHMSVHGSDTTAAAEGAPGTVFVGSHFNDKNTWWPHVGAFVNYIHRCCAVLQRGRFVADVLYYIGDECPALVLSKHLRASLGFGYDYDECNTEILLTRLSVQAGRLVTPDGMSYRLLVLPERPFLTVPVARKIRELVQAGATVLGPKPVRTPGLTGYPRCDAELKVITAELWDTGKVIADKPEKTVLATQGVPVDFAFTGGQPDALLDFIHRQDGDAELYFVINRRNRTEHVECAFRVTGKRPELWNAVDGSRRDAPAYRIANGATTVPLELPAYGSTFVIFRNPTTELTHAAAKTAAEQPVQDLTGPWQVQFDPKWGGPKEPVTFAQLADWTAQSEEGIKYYSGTATYRKTFDASRFTPHALRLFLNLGTVHQLAVVRLNGQNLGVVWCAPWRVDITAAVKSGANELEIDVVNTWFNRLVLDLSRPKTQRLIDSGDEKHYWGIPVGKGPLQPSGLLGPVTIQAIESTRIP